MTTRRLAPVHPDERDRLKTRLASEVQVLRRDNLKPQARKVAERLGRVRVAFRPSRG